MSVQAAQRFYRVQTEAGPQEAGGCLWAQHPPSTQCVASFGEPDQCPLNHQCTVVGAPLSLT